MCWPTYVYGGVCYCLSWEQKGCVQPDVSSTQSLENIIAITSPLLPLCRSVAYVVKAAGLWSVNFYEFIHGSKWQCSCDMWHLVAFVQMDKQMQTPNSFFNEHTFLIQKRHFWKDFNRKAVNDLCFWCNNEMINHDNHCFHFFRCGVSGRCHNLSTLAIIWDLPNVRFSLMDTVLSFVQLCYLLAYTLFCVTFLNTAYLTIEVFAWF